MNLNAPDHCLPGPNGLKMTRANLVMPQRIENGPILYPLNAGYLDSNGWRMARICLYDNGSMATHGRALCWTKGKRSSTQEGGLLLR